MTLHATGQTPPDNVLKFLTVDGEIRLIVADTTAALRHSNVGDVPSPRARRLYEEIFTICCLLRGLLTEEQRLTVNIRFAVPDHFVRCEADGTGNVHCSFSAPMRDFAGEPAELVGEGATLSITRGSWLGGMFTGTVDIVDPTPSRFFARFYTKSDQTETVFVTGTGQGPERGSGHASSHEAVSPVRGFMVQSLPFADPVNVKQLVALLQARANELHAVPWTQLPSLLAPYATLVESCSVHSECYCSKEMFLGMFMAVDPQELTRSIEQSKVEAAQCGVCGAEYAFRPEELLAIVGRQRDGGRLESKDSP